MTSPDYCILLTAIATFAYVHEHAHIMTVRSQSNSHCVPPHYGISSPGQGFLCHLHDEHHKFNFERLLSIQLCSVCVCVGGGGGGGRGCL